MKEYFEPLLDAHYEQKQKNMEGAYPQEKPMIAKMTACGALDLFEECKMARVMVDDVINKNE